MIKKILLFTITLLSLSLAEISLSFGLASTKLHQTHSHSLDLTAGNTQNLPTKTAIFYELDSFDHHLWLDNDRVIFGVGAISEEFYKDRISDFKSLNIYPLYVNYYLEVIPDLYIGPGINWSLIELHNKNFSLMISQLPGFSIGIRKEFKDSFLEFNWLQMKAGASYEEGINYYHTVNYLFRYGFYLEKN